MIKSIKKRLLGKYKKEEQDKIRRQLVMLTKKLEMYEGENKRDKLFSYLEGMKRILEKRRLFYKTGYMLGTALSKKMLNICELN